MTDPIADILTRIRNAIQARHRDVLVPASNLKIEIVKILKEEGFISGFDIIKDNKQGLIKIHLKYGPARRSVINGIKRISKPGLRIYVGKDEIPRVREGLGVAILSTSKGVMTDKKARELGVGGELLCSVY